MVTFAKAWKQQTSGQMTIGKACRIGALVLFVLLLLTWANYLFQLTGGHADNRGDPDCVKKVAAVAAQAAEASADMKAELKQARSNAASMTVKLSAMTKQLASLQRQVKAGGASAEKPTVARLYSERLCKGEYVDVSSTQKEESCKSCKHLEDMKFPSGKEVTTDTLKSIKITQGELELDLHEGREDNEYYATVYPFDGCSPIYEWPPTRSVRFVAPSLPVTATAANAEQMKNGKYRVIYSAEAGTYMGYQSQTSYYSFLTSGMADSATYTRLATARKEDDVITTIPSFFAKRHPFSKRYGPLNKPDVIMKYFKSGAKPTEEVIVIVDPDNWFTGSVEKYANMVKRGLTVGEPAFYNGNPGINALWKEVCKANCKDTPKHQGIPYVIHRDDLEVVAPLWRMYVLLLKQRFDSEPDFLNKYNGYGIQPDWCAEMFGWNYAVTHAGLQQHVEFGMQLRDVASRVSDAEWSKIPMIHMGRAWFPPTYTQAAKWWHTEGREFAGYGAQVWCKCNDTANDIIPWPVPAGVDHVSNATLSLMYGARQKWGKLPFNEFRHEGPNGYHFAPN